MAGAMLTFACGVCQTQLQAPVEQSGKLVRCPKCQTTLRVPAPVAEAAVATHAPEIGRHTSPAVPPMLAGAARPMGGKRYGFNCQYCSSRLETTEAQAGQEGACPTCGKAIVIPILDRYGRLIDPMTGKVVKQDPHPVHAYAAAGERAPRILRRGGDGAQFILCPKCKTQSPITANNCKNCGMPFTMEGTTAEAAGASNGYAVASLVLGIIGLPTCVIGIISGLGLIFGLIALAQTNKDNGTGGRGLAIAGIATSGVGVALFVANVTGLFR
jgi:ssDNA-binding Zn-finger/Zn-ribbon topoisomerase 1